MTTITKTTMLLERPFPETILTGELTTMDGSVMATGPGGVQLKDLFLTEFGTFSNRCKLYDPDGALVNETFNGSTPYDYGIGLYIARKDEFAQNVGRTYKLVVQIADDIGGLHAVETSLVMKQP